MWLIFALVYAGITSIHIPIVKKISSKLDSITYIFIGNFFIIPLMLGGVFMLGGIPHLENSFYIPILIASVIDTLAFVLAVTAFATSELSVIVPLAAFVPVVATIVNIFLTGETPSLLKFFGIVAVVVGTYILHLESVREGIFVPFQKLFAIRGTRLFLCANLLWGVVPIFQKKALYATTPHSPSFIAFVGTLLMSMYLLPFIVKKKSNVLAPAKTYFWWLFLAGILVTFQQFALQASYALQNVGYVLAIGKLSSLLVVIWGIWFFKERFTPTKMVGAIIMIAGATLLI